MKKIVGCVMNETVSGQRMALKFKKCFFSFFISNAC